MICVVAAIYSALGRILQNIWKYAFFHRGWDNGAKDDEDRPGDGNTEEIGLIIAHPAKA
ncbi:Stannin domain-containing protein [Dioscorea alata]|nr:Stannin domain-containing protein [Dioscorea alata]